MFNHRWPRRRLLLRIALILALIHLVRNAYRPAMVGIGNGISNLSKSYSDWRIAREKASVQHAIDSQTKNLASIDSAIVYVLGEAEQPPGAGFPIRPYNQDALVLREAKVVGGQAEKLAQIWRTRSFGGGGALCHDPVYGIRFYAADKLLCETSICWHCMNCYLQFPNQQYGWIGFGDEDELLLDFLQSIIALPDNTQAFIAVQRAERHFYDKNFQLALEELAKASRLAPLGAKVDSTRARVLQEMGDHVGAIQACTAAIEKSPHYSSAFLLRGSSYAAMNKPLEAILDYEEAMSIDSQIIPYALRRRSESFRAFGDDESADRDLENAMSLE